MKKKLLIGLLFIMLFFLIPISTLCISGNWIDPKNDVLILENYNYRFNMETFSINEDLIEEIKSLEFDYTSNKPTIDIEKIGIDDQGLYTEFVITVKEACAVYPSGDSNVFILLVIIEYDEDIFGAVYVKYGDTGAIVSKYGYLSDLADLPHVTLDVFKDFDLLNSDGELSFKILSADLPDVYEELYVVIGQATVSDLTISESNVNFIISDMYGDVYPNKIYGETDPTFPETEDDVIVPDDTSDSEDETDDTDQDINPFIVGFAAMIGFIIIMSGIVVIQGRKP